jgi:acetyl esterase/lipase
MIAGADAPPTLVLFGQAEQVVSPAQAAFVAQAWQAAGRPVETGALPLFDHGLDSRRGSVGGQWVEARTLRFLRANGAL